MSSKKNQNIGMGIPWWLSGENPSVNAGDTGLILGPEDPNAGNPSSLATAIELVL